jgi:DNA-binding MarR family transcriptional regulator
MDKLCEKGLIERIRCKEDRRVVYVVITKTGLSLLTKIGTHGNISFLDKLSEKEAAVLSDLLDKIR